jgi:uncharacterized protein
LSVKVTKTNSGIKFSIQVLPRASKNFMSITEEGSIKLKIVSPPVEGKANETCIKYIAGILGVAKSRVQISSGTKARLKIIEVTGDSDILYSKLIAAIQVDKC